MNKLAAEKIASEYYTVGVQLAMQNSGLVKEAGLLPKDVLKKLVEYPSAIAGAGLGALGVDGAYAAAKALNPELINFLQDGSIDALLPMFYAGLGGGALIGGNLGSKGLDLARKKVPKAIDALKKLRT